MLSWRFYILFYVNDKKMWTSSVYPIGPASISFLEENANQVDHFPKCLLDKSGKRSGESTAWKDGQATDEVHDRWGVITRYQGTSWGISHHIKTSKVAIDNANIGMENLLEEEQKAYFFLAIAILLIFNIVARAALMTQTPRRQKGKMQWW